MHRSCEISPGFPTAKHIVDDFTQATPLDQTPRLLCCTTIVGPNTHRRPSNGTAESTFHHDHISPTLPSLKLFSEGEKNKRTSHADDSAFSRTCAHTYAGHTISGAEARHPADLPRARSGQAGTVVDITNEKVQLESKKKGLEARRGRRLRVVRIIYPVPATIPGVSVLRSRYTLTFLRFPCPPKV